MSKLIKNTTIYTIGRVLPQAANFLLLPLYTRFLTPADYGIVNSMHLLATILLLLFSLYVDRAVYRLYYDYKTTEEKRDYLGTTLIFIVCLSVFVLFFLFLVKDYIGLIYKTIDFYPYYYYMIIGAFFRVFSLVPKVYFQVKEKASVFISLSLLEFVLTTSLILLYVVGFGAGAVGMLKASAFSALLVTPIYFVISLKMINFKLDFGILKSILHYSLPLVPTAAAAWILNLSDRIFIERYFSMSDVGIYSLGYKVAGIVLIFTAAFNQAYNPVFFKLANSEDQDEAKKKLYRYNNIFISITLLIFFVITIFSKEVIVVLLDPKYRESYKIVPIIAFAYLISQVSGLLNLFMGQEKKNIQLMYMIIFSAFLNIGLNFLLIPIFGVYGAGYATVLSFMVMFIVQYWYSKRCYFIEFNWKRLVPLGALLGGLVVLFQYILEYDLLVMFVLKVAVLGIIAAVFMKKHYWYIKSILLRK